MNPIKLHYVNTFSRSLMSSAVLPFANALFVTSIGGAAYPQLYGYANAATLLCYLFFVFFSLTGSVRLYFAVILATFAVSVGLAATPAASPVLIWSFAIAVVAIDIIAPTIAGNLLQSTVSGSVFKTVYQRLVAVETLMRIVATLLFWGCSESGHPQLILGVFWVACMLHAISTYKLAFSSRPVAVRPGPATEKRLRHVFSTFGFLRDNQLIRTALIISIWTYAVKFLAEALYYRAVDDSFHDSSAAGAFISKVTLVSLILAYAFRYFFAERMLNAKNPSVVFAVLPVGVLLYIALALSFTGIWPNVGLMVFFVCINRGIQLPMSRQCLVPVPDARKHSLIVLIYLITTVSALLLSGGLALVGKTLHTDQILIVLGIITVTVFYFLAKIDSYYVQNLWSLYQESHAGRWVSDLWTAPSLALRGNFRQYFAVHNDEAWAAQIRLYNHSAAALKRTIIEGYAADDDAAVTAAVDLHQRILASDNPQEVLAGVAVIGELSMQPLLPMLAQFTQHPVSEVRQLATSELALNEMVDQLDMAGFREHSRRKIKALLRTHYLTGSKDDVLPRLQKLLALPQKRLAANIIDVLNYYHDPLMTVVIWQCFDDDAGAFNVAPLLKHMVRLPFTSANYHRNILQLLKLPSATLTPARQFVDLTLTAIAQVNLNFAAMVKTIPQHHLLNDTLHAMFLEEVMVAQGRPPEAVVDVIGDLLTVNDAELAILVDMHLEVLKKSREASAWVALFK